jgi:hypothetical protein
MNWLRLARRIQRRVCGWGPKPEQRIFFQHVPKCGGTSLDRALQRCLADTPEAIIGLEEDALLHAFQVRLAECPGWEKSGRHDALAEWRLQLLLYFLSLPQSRYVHGHFPFHPLVFDRFGSQWNFITLIRHPVRRWFSHFFYKQSPGQSYYRIDEDIATFVNSPRAASWGRFYVHYFAGLEDGESGSVEASVSAALENLESYSLVGVLERIDDFDSRFQRKFGVRLRIGRENTSPAAEKARNEAISEEIRRRVTELCQPDLQIYHGVCQRLGIADDE